MLRELFKAVKFDKALNGIPCSLWEPIFKGYGPWLVCGERTVYKEVHLGRIVFSFK